MKTRVFVRLDGSGNVVPSSTSIRSKKPTRGKWVDITNAVNCCYAPAYLIVTNLNTSAATIDAITSDKGYEYTGDPIAYGQSVVIPLTDFTATVFTVETTGTAALTAEDGILGASGSITPACDDGANTYDVTVTPNYGDQYVVALSDDATC